MTSEVIVGRAAVPQDRAMTLRRFLLIDSLVLDGAGIAALVAGSTVLGVVLLAAAAVAFMVWLGLGRRTVLTS
jgi:hypothetical protein